MRTLTPTWINSRNVPLRKMNQAGIPTRKALNAMISYTRQAAALQARSTRPCRTDRGHDKEVVDYRASGGYRCKRVLDLGLAVPAFGASLPVQAAVALVVWIRMGRPVFFRQLRAGRDAVPFEVVKFRTMLTPEQAGGQQSDRARLTPVGSWLRRTSLDELPTLWNVIRGDMSLVGPRPLLLHYVPHYTPTQARRHAVRPGLTGLAQVGGRNETTWPQRLALDVEYVDTHSLRLDLLILCRTVLPVLLRRGISAHGEATMLPFAPDAPIAGRTS